MLVCLLLLPLLSVAAVASDYADQFHVVVPLGPLEHSQRPGFVEGPGGENVRAMLDVYELPVRMELPGGQSWVGRLDVGGALARTWIDEHGDQPFCLVRWAVNIDRLDDGTWVYDTGGYTPNFYPRDVVDCPQGSGP